MQILTSYFSQTVTESHLSLAVTILTTMIIGGCLIILVENQHIKGEIASRYYNIMRPFYHKLALYAKFAQQCLLALSAIDEEGKRYKKLLQDKTIDIKRLALRAVMTGKDNPYLNAKDLDSICNDINGIWYCFDRNYGMYSHLRFENDFLIEGVRNSLIEYDRTLLNEPIDLHLFPKVSGDFFVKEWQPIDNIPYNYEYFNQKCRNCNLYLCSSFVIEISSLILIFFSESFNNVSLASVDCLVLLPIGSFVFAIYKHFKLNNLLKTLQF